MTNQESINLTISTHRPHLTTEQFTGININAFNTTWPSERVMHYIDNNFSDIEVRVDEIGNICIIRLRLCQLR